MDRNVDKIITGDISHNNFKKIEDIYSYVQKHDHVICIWQN